MKRVLIGTVVLFALMTVALSATIPALAAVPVGTATVCVWDSGGANITPTTGGITYQLGGYTYNFANNVDASGCRYQDFAAGTTNLEVWVSHNNTTSAPVTQDISVNPNFAFQTSLATVRLEDAGGAPLDGGTVRYWVGTYVYNFPGGATGSSGTPGETYAEFFPGSYQFEMKYQWTIDTKTQDISTPVVFQTTNVSLYYSGQIRYGGPNGTYAYFNSPMELLPGSTNFELAGCGVTQLAFSGSAVEQNLACLKLEDHNGSPLAGGTARGGFGASYGTWHVPGSTDAGGVLIDVRDVTGQPGDMSYEMKYNNTTEHKTQDVSLNSIFDFQTSLATVRLEDCYGAPLDNGTVRYWVGTYAYYFPGGATGSSGTPGETYAEFFPGSYQFEMSYQWTTDTKTQDISTPVVFQTTNVTLYYSGQIRYGGPNGTYAYFNSPMELLPGSTTFELAGCGVTQLAFSGCSVEQNLACLKLEDHNGSPLAGGTARGGFGASYGTWYVPGSTDAGGVLIDVRDVTGQPGDMSYEMKYNHTTEHQTQDVSLNSIFAFDTNLLTLRLETCGGTGLAGGLARFGPGASYTNWWFPDNPGVPTDATGETSGEVFPGTFSFEMQYAGTADQKLNEVLPDADHLLTWQTTNVTLNYSGDISYGGPQGDYYWFVKPSMELLPGTYWFHFRDCGRHELTFSGCSYEDNTCVPGTIIVEKQTEPDGAPGSFVFSGDAAGSIADDGQIVVGDLQAGTYTSQETVPAGWTLDSIVCDDDNSSGDVNTGTATFQLEAAETVTCTFTNVKDNTAPDCSGATASPYSLWPPLHNFVAIDVLRVRDPDGDPVAITIDSIFQDEMVAPLAPCMTSPDGGGLGTATAWVRAERWFRGDGRVYHIGFTADDGWGGTCSGEVLVGVPVNSWDRVRDGGALYDSTQKFIHPPCTPPSP